MCFLNSTQIVSLLFFGFSSLNFQIAADAHQRFVALAASISYPNAHNIA